jgi:hypothetical protein
MLHGEAQVQANMAGCSSTSEHGSLQKYKRKWLTTEVQANMAGCRSRGEQGSLQKYERTWLATEVQVNMARSKMAVY